MELPDLSRWDTMPKLLRHNAERWGADVYLTASQGEYRDYYQTAQGRLVVIAAGIWWAIGLALLRTLKKRDTEPRVLGAARTGQPA